MKKTIKKTAKRLLAVLLAVMMVVGTMTVSTFAVEYEAPTSGMEADDIYITGSAYAASTVLLSILGVNITSSNGAGIYNSGGSSSAYGTDSSNLGIFGSDINDSPDPYLYNYFYNLNSTQSGSGDYSVDDMAAWTATPYTLRWDSNKQGPQGQASGSTTISINGVTKTCNPAFYYEPDLIIGAASGYSSELASYQATYNEDYDPTIISTDSSSGTRSDGLGLEYNMFAMSASLVEIGYAVDGTDNEDSIAAKTGKITRYDQSAYEIGTDYDKYNRGLYYWAQSAFADGTLTEIRYADSISYSSTTETWTIASGNGRANQYASGIGENIYDLLTDGYTFEDGTTITGSTDGYSLTTDQLIEIMTVEDEDGNKYAGVVIGSAGSDEVYTELTEAGITFLNNLPNCVYGMTMQTTENGMGIAFYLSFFYADQNEDLDPVSIMGYWLEHFYHVSDTDAMQTTIENMLSNADLNAAFADEELDISRYDEEAIEELIVTGIEYYQDTIEPALDAAVEGTTTEAQDELLESLGLDDVTISTSSLAYWSTLDTTIGIGSDNRNINAAHDYVLTEEVAATCTSEGYRVYTCSVHGETYTSTLDMIDHTYELVSSEDSTYISQGYEVYTCSVCGDTYMDVFDYVTALVYSDGTWYYYSDGAVDTDFTGLFENTNGTTYYIEEGICTLATTGLIEIDGTTYYIVDSRLQSSVTDLKYIDETWYYIVEGVVQTDFTGFYEKSNGTTYYIEDGICTLDVTGIIEITTTTTSSSSSGQGGMGGSGGGPGGQSSTTTTTSEYYYVVNSRLQTSVTGLKYVDETWYYIVEGVVDTDYTGLYENSNGTTYYIEEGICTLETTGYVEGEDGMYYVANSRLQTSVNGLKYVNETWYYFVGGIVDTDYTGLYENSNGTTYYIEEGICTLETTGVVEGEDGMYYVANSRLQTSVTGLKYIDGTWYYIVAGIVQTDYTGLYENSNGTTYYIEEGICTLATNTVYSDGTTNYVIINSRVTATY